MVENKPKGKVNRYPVGIIKTILNKNEVTIDNLSTSLFFESSLRKLSLIKKTKQANKAVISEPTVKNELLSSTE